MLRGDAAAVAGQLRDALAGGSPERWAAWRRELTTKVGDLLHSCLVIMTCVAAAPLWGNTATRVAKGKGWAT